MIAAQLARIEAGEAADIIRTIDERERENQTMCVGVRWDFERSDLLEIVEVSLCTCSDPFHLSASHRTNHRSRVGSG